jgi:hypothetical protein
LSIKPSWDFEEVDLVLLALKNVDEKVARAEITHAFRVRDRLAQPGDPGLLEPEVAIAVKPTGASRFTRYEVVGFGVANCAPAVCVDRMGPDNYWFGARPRIVVDIGRCIVTPERLFVRNSRQVSRPWSSARKSRGYKNVKMAVVPNFMSRAPRP